MCFSLAQVNYEATRFPDMRYTTACTALLLLGLSACDLAEVEGETAELEPVPMVAAVEEEYEVALLLSTERDMTAEELQSPGEEQIGTAMNLGPGEEGRLTLYPDSAATLVVFLSQEAEATMHVRDETTGRVVAEAVAEGSEEEPVRTFLVVEQDENGLTSRVERTK